MYFAWLGFYTNSMLYPAVIGFLLWMLAEADQVLGPFFFFLENICNFWTQIFDSKFASVHNHSGFQILRSNWTIDYKQKKHVPSLFLD